MEAMEALFLQKRSMHLRGPFINPTHGHFPQLSTPRARTLADCTRPLLTKMGLKKNTILKNHNPLKKSKDTIKRKEKTIFFAMDTSAKLRIAIHDKCREIVVYLEHIRRGGRVDTLPG
jgi:hypothetical protein